MTSGPGKNLVHTAECSNPSGYKTLRKNSMLRAGPGFHHPKSGCPALLAFFARGRGLCGRIVSDFKLPLAGSGIQVSGSCSIRTNRSKKGK